MIINGLNKLKKNKKGAVNTYRFIAIYFLLGLLMASLATFNINNQEVNTFYDLNTENRVAEIVVKGENILNSSETLVQSNQYTLTSSFLDERSSGRNVVQILTQGFLPTGLLPDSQNASELERGLNWIFIVFRWIIMLFAGYEIFQIIIKTKTT